MAMAMVCISVEGKREWTMTIDHQRKTGSTSTINCIPCFQLDAVTRSTAAAAAAAAAEQDKTRRRSSN